MMMALAAACSDAAYGEAPGGDAGSDAGTDTSTPTIDASAVDAIVDAGPDDAGPLIPNGGFEEPSAACGVTWELINASAVRATPARTGASACRVCNTGSDGYFGLRVNPRPQGSPGGWTLEAFYRTMPNAAAPLEAHLAFAWETPDGGVSKNPVGTIPADYQPLQIVARLGDDVSGDLTVQVAAVGNPGTCFLVDDVTLTVVRP